MMRSENYDYDYDYVNINILLLLLFLSTIESSWFFKAASTFVIHTIPYHTP